MIEGEPELAAELSRGLEPGSLDFLTEHGAVLTIRAGTLELVMAGGDTLSVELTPARGRLTLLRAAQAGRSPAPYIADATAGMGADAFELARAGCRVVAMERSPLAWILLKDGLRRAASQPEHAEAVSRIRLELGDARLLLPALGPFDVVYLDPMFQGGKATAGKRKSMRLFHQLGSAEEDGAGLLQAAQAAATGRVVVKRPIKGAELSGSRPSGSIRGRTVRFDIYAGQAAKLD